MFRIHVRHPEWQFGIFLLVSYGKQFGVKKYMNTCTACLITTMSPGLSQHLVIMTKVGRHLFIGARHRRISTYRVMAWLERRHKVCIVIGLDMSLNCRYFCCRKRTNFRKTLEADNQRMTICGKCQQHKIKVLITLYYRAAHRYPRNPYYRNGIELFEWFRSSDDSTSQLDSNCLSTVNPNWSVSVLRMW